MKYIFFLLLSFSAYTALACNNEEATNKRLALERATEVHFAGKRDHEIPMNMKHLAVETAKVGQIIGSGDYKAACAEYDRIAKKYNINLKEFEKSTYTLKDYEKFANDKSGCATEELHKLGMDMVIEIDKKVVAGKLPRTVLDNYIKELSIASAYVYSDWNKYCSKMRALEKKYKEGYLAN
jgi:hypothetical protein